MDYTDHIKQYHKPFLNIYGTLVNSAVRYPDKIAIADDERSVTYAQLLKEADNYASKMSGLKLSTGDQVGFVMVNSIRMVSCFYGAVKLGCIVVMINTKFKAEEIAKLLSEMDVKAVFCDERWKDKVTGTAEKLGICHVITENYAWGEIEEKKTSCVQNPDHPAVIMHTSGTSGPPKGVMITHRNILETAYGYQEIQGLDSSAVTVLSVSLFHILGLSCVTTYFIYLGGTIVMSAFYDVNNVLKNIVKWKATHFHSVPTVYHQIIHAGSGKVSLSSLKVTVCGGAPIKEERVSEFVKLAPDASFRLAYGMTETAGSGALSHGHREPLKAVKNVYIEVQGKNGRSLKPYEKGEIVFYGPVVAKGRWNCESLKEDRMPSGDIGYMDEEGRIFVLDRMKDLINRGGEKIFPSEIESTLLEYPGITAASVVGVRDEEYGELPAAVVVPGRGEKVDKEALKCWMKERTATFKMPCMFEIWDSLPVTQNGKEKKTEIRKMLEEMRDNG